jgi:hypothetical protein
MNETCVSLKQYDDVWTINSERRSFCKSLSGQFVFMANETKATACYPTEL